MDASCQSSLRAKLEALGKRMLALRTSLDDLAGRADKRDSRDEQAKEELRRAEECLRGVREVREARAEDAP